ncbi:MAG: efflux RND transporter periplasmic adaptor subunit [Flavobacteriaceae bacterium]|nr:efflux RND transporter periplasmic adaptor subunit [Flavobacteriaceae bacterium]
MKKTIISVSFSLFLLACGQETEKVASSITNNKGTLDELEIQKANYTRQIKGLTLALDSLNQKLEKMSGGQKKVLVTALEIKPQIFNHTIEIQANIKTRKNLQLFPEFGGRLNQILVKEGQEVKKGTLLAVIDDAGLQDQLDQMKLQLELVKTTFERTQRLWDQKIGSEMMYLEAKTRFKSQQKQVAQMRNQLSKTKIYAPFSGVIDEIIARKGSTLVPGMTPIMRIVNLDNMYVESDVPENYLANITKGSLAKVSIPVLNVTQNTVVRQTGNFIQPNNRTFRVEAPIKNPTGMIKPNLNARLSIVDYSNLEALMIPFRVIRKNAKGNSFVFILTGQEENNGYIAEQRFVTLGMSKDELVEITKGVNTEDLIVDEGVSLLVTGQKVKRIEQ